MQCPSCEMMLAPGTTICPRCGTQLSYTPDSDEVAYVDYASTDEEARPASSVSQEQAANGAVEKVAANVGLQAGEVTQSPPQESSSEDVQQEPLPVVTPLTRQPRSFSAVTLILLIALVLVVVIGGSGLVYFAAVIHPAELNVQATAVARGLLTKQVQSTANAQVGAVFDALTPEQVYTRATRGIPVINDPLSGPDGSIWYNYHTTDSSCSFLRGAYHIIVSLKASNNSCYAFNSLFNNMAFQVQMTIINGDAGGLLFHIGQGFYLFLVNQNGSYGLYIGIGIIAPLTSGKSSAINGGLNRSNLLTIVASDGRIYLYVNKHPVAHIFDNTFNSGQIALFGGSATGLTDVAFNNVQVWSL